MSGLSIAGLVAAAFLIFGRFGWLGKIAGAFLGMMLIGNNAGVFRTPETETCNVPVHLTFGRGTGTWRRNEKIEYESKWKQHEIYRRNDPAIR